MVWFGDVSQAQCAVLPSDREQSVWIGGQGGGGAIVDVGDLARGCCVRDVPQVRRAVRACGGEKSTSSGAEGDGVVGGFSERVAQLVRASPALRHLPRRVARYAPQLGAHITADMLLRGREEAGPCPTRQGFVEGLRAVDGHTAGGLIGSTDFDADFRQRGRCYAFTRVNAAGDGFEVIDPNFCGTRIAG